jgi:protein-disulfide isomerase
VPDSPIAVANRPTRGSSAARVAIVEYSDFQCPYCGDVARDTLPDLARAYVDTGKVILIFKHLPLSIHPLAPAAASAASCAGEQSKFWEMHDQLFSKPAKLAAGDLRAAAGEIGLDLTRFDQCRNGAAAAKLVEDDTLEAERLGVTATPTFIFGRLEPGGRVRATDVMTGAKPAKEFKRILDRLLRS